MGKLGLRLALKYSSPLGLGLPLAKGKALETQIHLYKTMNKDNLRPAPSCSCYHIYWGMKDKHLNKFGKFATQGSWSAGGSGFSVYRARLSCTDRLAVTEPNFTSVKSFISVYLHTDGQIIATTEINLFWAYLRAYTATECLQHLIKKYILHSSPASKLSRRHDLINKRIISLRRVCTKSEVCPIAIFPALLQRNLLGSSPAADPAGERNE